MKKKVVYVTCSSPLDISKFSSPHSAKRTWNIYLLFGIFKLQENKQNFVFKAVREKKWYISTNMEESYKTMKGWSDKKYLYMKSKGPWKVLQIMFNAFFLQITSSVFITVFSVILVLIYPGRAGRSNIEAVIEKYLEKIKIKKKNRIFLKLGSFFPCDL